MHKIKIIWKNYWLEISVFVLYLLTLKLYAPGSMSDDSVFQLLQARAGIYTDAHPPIMAFAWRFMDKLYPGSTGMLAIHLALYWFGIYLIASARKLSGKAAALFIFFVGLFPPTLGLLARASGEREGYAP